MDSVDKLLMPLNKTGLDIVKMPHSELDWFFELYDVSDLFKFRFKIRLTRLMDIFIKYKIQPVCDLSLFINTITVNSLKWLTAPNYLKRVNQKSECVVCGEETSRVTYCDHYLCYDCYSKLQNSKCPYCRQDTLNLEENRLNKESNFYKACQQYNLVFDSDTLMFLDFVCFDFILKQKDSLI